MRNLIGLIVILLTCVINPVYAANPTLKIKISGVGNKKNYYLCIYGVGCLNMKTDNADRNYPISPMDLGNITKFVVTDLRNMQMYAQPTNNSCQLNVKNNQKVTISGHLNIINNQPVLSHLRCAVA